MRLISSRADLYNAMVAAVISALFTVPGLHTAHAADSAAPAQPKLEKLTFDEAKKQLQRKAGQTEFLDLQYAPEGNNLADGRSLKGGTGMPESAAASALGAGTDKRSVVESDVFAIDPTTKNLYLLTNDRGLIVLNEKDEAVGRVAASGNRPDMMYLFSDKKNLVVLEQDWEKVYENQNADATQSRTQIVQYDISTPDRPKVSKVISIDGNVVDSRVVGKVLYITSSVYPRYNSGWGFFPARNTGSEQPKGRVTSVNLDKLEVITSVDSQLPSGSNNMIRIVEEEVSGGKFQYYALAVSPQAVDPTGWWWRRASQVEVFDITDPNGAIKATFRTSLKGNIQKATQVNLANGYVVAVSNYPTNAAQPWNAPWRLVAESFKLPSQGDKVIKKVEAEYRLDQIKTKAEGLKGEELDKKIAELNDDATIGLRNVFVTMEDGVLSKYVPDSFETSGDTTGLSANLRDVRFGRGKNGLEIYAFWVPQNNIDPFDLFTVNEKDGSVKYVTRLQYEGWVERSIPFEHDGKKLVLSLGYMIKPNDPQMKRFPQVLLFEITGSGKKVKLDKIEDLTLSNSGIWADLQGEDKTITFSFDAKAGKGAVLFPVSGYSKKQGSFSGGKIVGFDLNKIDEEESIFKDGALILGDAGWMKRVFEDSRSQVLRTFSDQEIAAFPSFADALKTTDEKLDAIRRVELARDMVAFLPVADGLGLQVVRKGDYNEGATQLRLVKRSNADTDATKITAKLDVSGTYAGHYALQDGKFLVFSNRQFNRPSKDPKITWGEWVQEYTVSVVEANTAATTPSLALVSKTSWENKDWNGFYSSWSVDKAATLPSVVEVNKFLLWNAGNQIFQIDTSDTKKVTAKKFEVSGLPGKDDGIYSVTLLNLGGGNLGVHYSLPVEVDSKQAAANTWMRLSLTRGFLAEVDVKADGSAAVQGKAINIPGNPMALMHPASTDILITRDNPVTDIIEEENGGYRANQAPYLQSLEWGTAAKLADSMRANDLAPQGFQRIGDNLVSLKAEQAAQGPIWMHRAMAMDAMPGRWAPRPAVQKANLEVLKVDAKGNLELEARVVPRYALPGQGSLLAALAKPGSKDEYVLALGSGSRVQVYDLNATSLDIKPRGLFSYDEYNSKSKESTLVTRIPGTGRWYYWGWYGASNPSITMDPNGDRLFISMGLSGVFTLDVTDAPKVQKPQQPKAEEEVPEAEEVFVPTALP